MTKVGAGLTLGVTTPIITAGATAVKVGADFEAALSKVEAISGATGDEMISLRDKAIEMGAKTKFSLTESAEAFQYMAMAGWDTGQMLEGIEGIMSLAAATDGLDLATTSDIVTDALTGFGLSAKDSSHFADVLAKASSSANTNVSMLGESFKYVAPVAGTLGYSAEDTAVALGLMANSGIKASQAGTSLRGALGAMIKPSDKASALMKQYNISLSNTDGTMKSLQDVMLMLRNRFKGMSQEEQAFAAATIFGREAMSGMMAIINASEEDFTKLTYEINNADGAAKKMSEIQLDNLSGQITILKSSLEVLSVQIAEMLMPHIKQFVEWLQNLVNWFTSLDEETQNNILKWAILAAAVGPALMIFGQVAQGISGIISLFSNLSNAASLVSSAFSFLLSPAGLVVMAI